MKVLTKNKKLTKKLPEQLWMLAEAWAKKLMTAPPAPPSEALHTPSPKPEIQITCTFAC